MNDRISWFMQTATYIQIVVDSCSLVLSFICSLLRDGFKFYKALRMQVNFFCIVVALNLPPEFCGHTSVLIQCISLKVHLILLVQVSCRGGKLLPYFLREHRLSAFLGGEYRSIILEQLVWAYISDRVLKIVGICVIYQDKIYYSILNFSVI